MEEQTNNEEIVVGSQIANEKKGKGKTVAIVLAVVVLVGAIAFGYYYLYSTLQDTRDELATTQNQLDEANQQIASLEDRAKELRDKKRKKDLSLFTGAFRDYRATNGQYLTTEGAMALKVYESELSKYVDDFTEPTTDKLYGFEAIAPVHTPSPLELGVIQYQWYGKCSTVDQDFIDTSDANDAAIRTVLESGETYCLDI